MSKFTDILGLFRELNQGTGFYTKLSEILLRLNDTITGFVSASRSISVFNLALNSFKYNLQTTVTPYKSLSCLNTSQLS